MRLVISGSRVLGFLAGIFGGGAKRIAVDRRFQLVASLGYGSMSKVWRAMEKQTGRTVCIKILDKEKTKALKNRFVGRKRPDEGVVAVGLDHPRIVKTFEHGITPKGEEVLIMEFVQGIGLNVLIETGGPQLEGNELTILADVADAMTYFHEKGFIHRDLCPRNILVTPDGRAKLIDFGLAVPNTPEFRQAGNRTGTLNYMAPELIRRVPTDERIDIFGYGVVAYETMTRSLPWPDAKSVEIVMKHLNQPPHPPLERRPDLPKPIVAWLLKTIERDPANRFQSMKEVRDTLARIRSKIG